MPSVTQVVEKTKQPRGGYLNPHDFGCIEMPTEEMLDDITKENLSPSMVGTVVDYLTRFMLHGNRDKAFQVARAGSRIVGFEDYFQDALDQIKELDDRSITKACKAASFDSVFRAGVLAYRPVEEINPNEITINNIRIMVKRSLAFFEKYGPVTSDGFTFEDAYTEKIDSGDGDFLTKDTMWDFKVSINEPTAKHTLQLLIYFLMGKQTGKRKYKSLEKIGIFNPRLNKVYTYEIVKVPVEIKEKIRTEIIGY
jgi:hypothetical protein